LLNIVQLSLVQRSKFYPSSYLVSIFSTSPRPSKEIFLNLLEFYWKISHFVSAYDQSRCILKFRGGYFTKFLYGSIVAFVLEIFVCRRGFFLKKLANWRNLGPPIPLLATHLWLRIKIIEKLKYYQVDIWI